MRLLLFFIIITSFVAAELFAQGRSEEQRAAREVFEEADKRRAKITNETARMEMIIHDARGRTRTRIIQSYSYTDNYNSKSLLLFESPGSVRGTGFLSVSERGEEVQRLYLPELGRVQTISSSEKSDRFMGSDFTYEDLAGQDPDNYEFLWMETDDEYYRIRARKKESPQYAVLTFQIRRETLVLQMIEYMDENETVMKRLEAENFENLYEDVWSPRNMTMYDLQENRKTELIWQNRTVNESIPDWRFTERGLLRGLN